MDAIQREAPLRVGAWILYTQIGSTPSGSSWYAMDALGRPAIVKLIEPDRLPDPSARAHHPALPPRIAASAEPRPHVVVGLAPGRSLAEILTSTRPSTEQALQVAAVLTSALATCHAAGITHGDVRAANVLLELATGHLTLVDLALPDPPTAPQHQLAPEVIAGQPGTPASDVYGLGLVIWQLLYGAPPEPGTGAPQPPSGPPWLQALLSQALDPRPDQRPSASALAEALEANGVEILAPRASDLALRARALHVTRPQLDQALVSLLTDRLSTALLGPPGSGRTHALAAAANALAAQGVPFVTLHPSPRPWGAVEAALADPGLAGPAQGLPEGSDPSTRAAAAAAALLERSGGPLAVLVDDHDRLDEGTRRTAAALDRAGAAVLLTGGSAPDWIRQVLHLAPFTQAQVEALLGALLGPLETEVPGAIARACPSAWPGDLVGAALAAVRGGGLRWQQGRWIVGGSLPEILPTSPPELSPALSEQARRIGAFIALAQPIPRSELLDQLGPPELVSEALSALANGGWIQGAGICRCTSSRATLALEQGVPDLAPIWQALGRHLLRRRPIPWAQLGLALVGAHDVEAVATYGITCIEEALKLDISSAVALAEALCTTHASPDLVAARVRALIQAGQLDGARAAGTAWLGERQPFEGQDLPVLLAMATLEEAAQGSPESITHWIEEAQHLLGSEPLPTVAGIALVRTLYRTGELKAAEAAVNPLCAFPPDLDQLEDWLIARSLLARIRADRGRPEDGLAVLTTVPDDLGTHLRAQALMESERGQLLLRAGRPGEGAEVLEAAAARSCLSTIDRARLEHHAARCWLAAGDPPRAVASWEAALARLEAADAPSETTALYASLCEVLCALGRWSQATTAGQLALERARQHAQPLQEVRVLCTLGDAATWQRLFTEALKHYDAAEALASEHGLAEPRIGLARRRSELAAHRRDPGALDLAEEAGQLAERHGDALQAARCAAVRALLLAQTSSAQEAGRAVAEALASLSGDEEPAHQGRLWVAEALLALGEADRAQEHAARALSFAEARGLEPLRAWAERLLSWSQPEPDSVSAPLERLTEFTVRVARQLDPADVLGELAASAVELIGAERAFALCVEDGALQVVASAGEATDTPPSIEAIQALLDAGPGTSAADAPSSAAPGDSDPDVSGLLAPLCLPLTRDGAIVGALYLDGGAHQADALAMARALVAHAGVALHHATTTRELQQRTARTRELVHDLRQPLLSLVLLAQAPGHPSASGARLVTDGARHALEILDDALRSGEATQATLEWGSTIQRWIGGLQPQARAAELHIALDAAATGWVYGRPSELRRVIANLMANAIQHTPPQSTIEVQTLVDPDWVGISITDLGPGIPEADLERVFEAGPQGPHTAPDSGPDLAIVRRICRAHGGDVTFENKEEGSTFIVRIPRAFPTQSPPPR